MTKQYPPQAERVPLSASASRYQRRNMATGSKNPPALARTLARLSRPDRTDPMAGLPVCRLNPPRTFSCPLSFTLAPR